MTRDQFIESCRPYLLQGTMTLHPNPEFLEDNPHYFTAWFFAVFEIVGWQIPDEEHRNYMEYLRKTEVMPGLFTPKPGDEIISHDETIGIAYIDPSAASRLLEYGRRNWYSWSNLSPDKFTLRGWQVRFLAPIAFYFQAAGQKSPWWANILCAIDYLTAHLSKKGNTSGRMLLLLMALKLRNSSSWIVRKSLNVFSKKLIAQYGWIDGLAEIYFPGHPIAIELGDFRNSTLDIKTA